MTESEPKAEDVEPQDEEDASAAEPEAPQPEPVPVPVHQVVQERQVGVFPLVLGGLLAGAIGFGAGYFGWLSDRGNDTFPAETRQAIGELNAGLGELSSAQASLAPMSALEETRSKIDDLRAEMAPMAERLAALDLRVLELEKRPVAEGLSDVARAAYEADIAELRDEIARQSEEFRNLVEQARASEAQAQSAQDLTQQRALLTEIRLALDSGVPFAAALERLEAESGISAPTEVARLATDGAPTLAELQAEFPAAARRALTASRLEASSNSGGIGDFLKAQLGARSVTPQDGEDADAILSRAEDHLRNGRLSDVITELSALPDSASAEIENWAALVRARESAIVAVRDHAAALNLE